MVGRVNEIEILNNCYHAEKSDFIALYGRRRVGKTYLIRNLFKDKMTFHLTGLANVKHQMQLANFKISLRDQDPKFSENEINNWLDAFQEIKKLIENSNQKKKVIFIDELPWFDIRNSFFIQALEHFWNSWASNRKDVLLIVCGSAAAWMLQKIINNKGGLHNRLTHRLKIEPFTLKECQHFAISKGIHLDEYQLIQLYMVLGGIPYYWEYLEKGKSASQQIDKLCFSKNGILQNEFRIIFKSLFNKYEKHEAIIKVLSKKLMGLTRDEIIRETKMSNGGSITRLLFELEESGFIRKYEPFERKSRNSLYQLSDFYSMFYLRFIQNEKNATSNHWIKLIDNPKQRAWSGYAFEQICLYHQEEILKALGINGMETKIGNWKSTQSENGIQIDLLIDRRDQIINLCEIKFSINPFEIDKKYDLELRNKIHAFKTETKTRKSIFLTFISTFGLKQNEYAGNIQNDLQMNLFFKQ
jgi:AAA+ ATPase superfamily predicted ATPase